MCWLRFLHSYSFSCLRPWSCPLCANQQLRPEHHAPQRRLIPLTNSSELMQDRRLWPGLKVSPVICKSLSLSSACIFLSMCFCRRDKQELLSKHLARVMALVQLGNYLDPWHLGIATFWICPFAKERLCSQLHNIIASVAVRISSDLYEPKPTCSKQLRQDGESNRAPILETDVEIRNSTKGRQKWEQ